MGFKFASTERNRVSRRQSARSSRRPLAKQHRRSLLLETLERRELFAISFEFNFLNDIPSFGFNDSTLGAARRTALQTAAANFGAFFDHTATIEVDVSNLNLANGTGATAGGEFVTDVNSGFIMNVPQQKALSGIDLNGGDADGHLAFNWGAVNTTPAEFGLDVRAPEVDFNSIIYHELTHLMGFISVVSPSGADLFNTAAGQPGVWTTFDKFLSDKDGNPIINQTTHTININLYNQERTNGNNLNQGIFFNGPNARAANGNAPVAIHSPNPFAPGSSLSHTRITSPNVTDQNSLLVFSISTGPISRRWNALEIAMLKDLGYSISALPTGVSFEASSGKTSVSEAGTSDTILVRLDSRPTSNVVLNVTSSNPNEAIVDKSTLTFTPTNWGIVQTLTVTGVNDGIVDGDQNISIQLAVDDNLSNDAYDPVSNLNIPVTVTDVIPLQIVVTTADDELDADLSNLNDMSLREALVVAANNLGPDKIVFAPGLRAAPVNLSLVGDNSLGPSALRIDSEVTIEGPIEISRNTSLNDMRLFYVTATGKVTFDRVTLSNGEAIGGNGGASAGGGGGGGAGLGGAIFNQGTVNVIASTLNNNLARGGNGGNSDAVGLGEGGGGGGGLQGNGNNATSSFGALGNSGGGTGGNLVISAGQTVAGNAGGNTTVFGAGGGGGGSGQNTNINGFSIGGIGGSAGFGGGGGGSGQAFGGTVLFPDLSAAGFGGGFGGGQGGGGGGGLGGAIFNDGGTLVIYNSTLSNNTARGGDAGTGGAGIPGGQSGQGLGGALFNRDGTITVRQSTLAENFAQIGNGNTTTAEGTAIYNLQSTGNASVTLFNSILASSDIRSDAINNGGTISGAGNLIEVANNIPSAVIATSNPPQLGPLALNGGSTRTHALLADSPAINAGVDAERGASTTDQRGTPFARKIGTQVDIGAFEFFPVSALVVSTLTDELDADLSDGDVSLREAITLANSTPGADVITFKPNLTGTIQLTLGELTIDQSLSITGNGANNTVIDANQLSRVLKVNPTTSDVTLTGLTLKNGKTSGNLDFGAGIYSQAAGSLTVIDSIITGNETTGVGANGAGIRADQGFLAITRSTISNNRASGLNSDGGGIDLRTGQLNLTSSTISGNQATSRGGGVTINAGSVSIVNSTLNQNVSVDRGGAVFADTTTNVTVVNSTITDNQTTSNVGGFGAGLASFMGNIRLVHATIASNAAAHSGGGVYSTLGSLTADNSIIASNTGQQGQPDFSIASSATVTLHSTLIGDNTGTNLVGSSVPNAEGNIIGTPGQTINPRLAPLADNGGPTQTRALLPNSPAFERGNSDLSLDANNAPITTDQRGNGFPRLLNDAVDMGAYELRLLNGITINESDGSTRVNESGTTDSFTVVLTAQPSQDVVLNILIGDPSEVGTEEVTLTFTSSSWNTPQTVTVKGIDDTLLDGDQITQITVQVDDAASDDNYDAVADLTINVTTVDNEVPTDFGDAPTATQSGLANSYPTTLADDGPRHAIGSLFLGAGVDAEEDGLPDAQAGQGTTGGDDKNGSDDEDGVTVLATLLRSNNRTNVSSLRIVSSQAGKLDAWIDFDRSGSFGGTEHLSSGTSINLVAGVNVVPITIPAGAIAGSTAGRFRLSTSGNLSPTGVAADGEVEDYLFTIVDGEIASEVTVNVTGSDTTVSDENNEVVIKAGGVELFRGANTSISKLQLKGSDANETLRLNGLPLKPSGANLRSINGTTIPFTWDAAGGTDTLVVDGGIEVFDLTQLASDALVNIETIDLTPAGATNLILDVNHFPSSGGTTPTTILAGTGDRLTFDAGWKIVGTVVTNNQFVRRAERLNAAVNLVTPFDWYNPINGLDVDGNGSVQAIDALLVINVINAVSPIDAQGNLPDAKTQNPLPTAFFDVDGDNKVLPIDALLVINELNRTGSGEPSDDPFAAVDAFFDEFGGRKRTSYVQNPRRGSFDRL